MPLYAALEVSAAAYRGVKGDGEGGRGGNRRNGWVVCPIIVYTNSVFLQLPTLARLLPPVRGDGREDTKRVAVQVQR